MSLHLLLIGRLQSLERLHSQKVGSVTVASVFFFPATTTLLTGSSLIGYSTHQQANTPGGAFGADQSLSYKFGRQTPVTGERLSRITI